MGSNSNATTLLTHLSKKGVAIGKVLTLYRQRRNLTKRDLQKNLNAFGYEAVAAGVISKSGGYLKSFLELPGAEQLNFPLALKSLSNEKIFALTPQPSDYEHIIWKKEKISPKFQKLIRKPLRKMPRSVNMIAERFALMKSDAGTADSIFFKTVVI